MTESRHNGSDNLWAARSLARWRRTATIAAVVMLATLAWAPTKEIFRPWRRVQARYNALASGYGIGKLPIKVRQIWIPEALKADRCGTCHLATTGAPPLEGHPPFESHPPVPHPPETFGCTYCHSGQGWATEADDAHGEHGSWPHPLFTAERTEAGCGTCHSGTALPLPETVEDAPDLVEAYGCLLCHTEGGSARTLDGIAFRGVPSNWVELHKGLVPVSDEVTPLVEADEEDLGVLDAWLQTQIGAPHLARGKMIFHQLGCLGCHRRNRVGGDVGPELTYEGDKDVRDLDGEGAGTSTLPDWLRLHVLDPQSLAADSRMPPVDPDELDRETDVDDLVTYLLSLRKEVLPLGLTPPDRARERFGLGRDFPTTGRGLYVTFCSACHGQYASGAELETLGLTTPMVGSRGFLAAVSPRYVRSTIVRGRRGRYMPAWGPNDGGLHPEEIDAIVDYLFSRGFKVRPYDTLKGTPDRAHGAQVFADRCAYCHQAATDGSGSGFGTQLTVDGALRHFTRPVLYQAIRRGWVEEGMPSFAFLRSADARDLVAFLLPRPRPAVEADIGHDGMHSNFGHQVWQAKCGACHGVQGEGGEGPLLNSEPYLGWAGDGYLAARIRTHRGGRAAASIGTLSADDLEAILDYLRSWGGRIDPAPGPLPDPQAIERGRALYGPRCTRCHGEAGRGKTAPALANRDFTELVTRPFLAMTILEGRKGTAMAAWHSQSELPVGVSDAFDLADYILSLGAPADEPAVTATVSTTSADDNNTGGHE